MADVPLVDFIKVITWISLHRYLDGIFSLPNLGLSD